ncbi:MAG TPA: AtpZ/AtpI family protein [Candidatus Competibacteraceae bacterium]|nr:AtpZ/AtpI family protein [Candidatus Competibacteraceae bacterium]
MKEEQQRLRRRVEHQAARLAQAEKDRPTLLAQSVYLGGLALLFIVPLVGGAYLGNWLDNQAEGYSFGWTIGLTLLGLVIGVVNVCLFIREH